MISDCSRIIENVIITDLTSQETIYAGNRFLIYAIYPDQNVEVRVMWGKDKQNVVLACGHSILNRTCQSNIGELMLKYGGGGHSKVGTCQVSTENWKASLEEVGAILAQNG